MSGGELEQLRLLAAVSEVAVSTLDPHEALRGVGRLFVRDVADWTVADLLTAPDTLCRVAVTHRRALSGVASLEGELPRLPRSSRSALVNAVRQGSVMELGTFEDPDDADSDLHREQLGLYRVFDAGHVLIAPLVARSRVVGALTVGRTRSSPPFGADDRQLVEAAARRAAIAIDNARLYTEQADTAVAFQRNLLPALPQPDDLRMMARYTPARQAQEIGGDWYDAFVGPDGITTIVIGDVVGHDLYATAHMAELRNMLRGCAWHAGPSPPEMLARLNDAVVGLGVGVMATALVGRLEREGDRDLFRWASAGHLPPLLASPGQPAQFLPTDNGILVGVRSPARYAENRTIVPPGSTVLLYTDGLVEHRGDLRTGMDALADAVTQLAAADLETLCDEVLAHFDGPSDDDIAMLAVRFPIRNNGPAVASPPDRDRARPT